MNIDYRHVIVLLSLAAASSVECSASGEEEVRNEEGKVDYTGYKVLRLIPHSDDQLEHLTELYDKYEVITVHHHRINLFDQDHLD